MLQSPLGKGPEALSGVGFSKDGMWFSALGYVPAPVDNTLPSIFPGQQPPWGPWHWDLKEGGSWPGATTSLTRWLCSADWLSDRAGLCHPSLSQCTFLALLSKPWPNYTFFQES